MEAFTVGALLGDVFFHSIPHLIEDLVHGNEGSLGDALMSKFFIMILGIFICYFIEVICNKALNEEDHKDGHEGHSHSHTTKTGAIVSLIGDFAHNITDGILLAITF